MTYTLTESRITKREMELHVPILDPSGFESRGATLARALKGRYAREKRVFYMTPGRARKWERLFNAGFHAVKSQRSANQAWRFEHPQVAIPRKLELVDAMRLADTLGSKEVAA